MTKRDKAIYLIYSNILGFHSWTIAGVAKESKLTESQVEEIYNQIADHFAPTTPAQADALDGRGGMMTAQEARLKDALDRAVKLWLAGECVLIDVTRASKELAEYYCQITQAPMSPDEADAIGRIGGEMTTVP